MVSVWQQLKGFAVRGAAALGLILLVTSTVVLRAFPAVEPPKLRVLILSGLNNHDWRSTTPVIRMMFADCARFGTVDVTDDPAGLNPAALARYDVLVSNWSSAEWAATGQVTLPPPALWPSTPAALTAANLDLNATFSAVARYRYGDERKPLHALEQLVLYANSLAGDDPRGFRGDLADRMAALLTSADATPAAKALVCAQLANIATEKQAAALNGLLTGEQPVADAALRALQRIPGSTVDRMLRDALGKVQGELKVSVIVALGNRRDREATEPLIAILAGTDETLAAAAASALGQFGGDAAVAALRQALIRATGQLRTDCPGEPRGRHHGLRGHERLPGPARRPARGRVRRQARHA